MPGAGRGWLARRPVHKGELLLEVPRASATEVADDPDTWEAELALVLLRRRCV